MEGRQLALYDYRNRQYDPAAGRFTTPDPIGAHGDWNNLGNAYTYVGNNPGAYVDPFGDVAETVWDAASLTIGLGSLGYNLWHGRLLDAGLDTIGIVADAAATAIPFIPGGAGITIKGYRATRIVRTVQHVDTAISIGQGTVAGIQAAQAGDTCGALISGGVVAFQTGVVGTRAIGVHSRRNIVSAPPPRTTAGAISRNEAVLSLPVRATDSPSRLLTGPSQGKLNALRGNQFQRSVNTALGVDKRNMLLVPGFSRSGKAINVEPDLLGGRFGVTEIRDRINVSFTRQVQAEADIARRMGTSFNLVVSPRTQTVSIPLREAIELRGGIIVEYNQHLNRFSSVDFDLLHRNRILR